MMKHITTLTAIAIALTCGSACGDEPGPNYQHLKPMEWIIGTWVLEVGAPEDAPEDSPIDVKKGDPIKWVLTCKWGLNKNVIETHATLFIKGVLTSTGEGRLGWAADKEQIIGSGFDTLGGRGETVYTIVDDKTFKMKGKDVKPTGEIATDTTMVTLVDEDTVTSVKKDITVGGEKKPDDPPVQLKRLKK